jgi:hypothetical protein
MMFNKTNSLLPLCSILGLLLLALVASAKQPTAPPDKGEDIRKRDARYEEDWAYSVGVQNYVFGLPLVIFERERKLRLDPVALDKAKKFAPAALVNQIGHMKALATADDVMPYTPNNDTVYSGALVELADEPIILTAPALYQHSASHQVVC